MLEKQKAKKQQENISLHNPWHQFQEYISSEISLETFTLLITLCQD
jgi:hypothetical protein